VRNWKSLISSLKFDTLFLFILELIINPRFNIPHISIMDLNTHNIAFLSIFHREVGSKDEAAAEVEQQEKILYYYPPQDNIRGQLTNISLCEGLIDFSIRLTGDEVGSVVLQKKTLVFKKFGVDLWGVLGIENPTSDHIAPYFSVPSVATHSVSDLGGGVLLTSLYEVYSLLFGRIYVGED